MVDAPDLGSGAARCGGSSPLSRTRLWFFYCYFDVLLLGIVLRRAAAWRIAKCFLVALSTAHKHQKHTDSNPYRYLSHLDSPCYAIISKSAFMDCKRFAFAVARRL